MEPFFSYVSGGNILSCCLIVSRNDVNIYDKNVPGEILRKKGGKTTSVILPPFLLELSRTQSPACSGCATTSQSVAPENYVATNE